MGEHAAVYGRPALVAAAGLRLTATVAEAAQGVELALADFPGPSDRTGSGGGLRETTTWEEVLDVTRGAREAWERYITAPSSASFRSVETGTGPTRLLRIALGEAARAGVSSRRDPTPPTPIGLTVHSAIPVGSGFGSSAAAAVAVIFAYLVFRGETPDANRLHRLSLEVERRQHGTPSGVDNATVIHGGVISARRREDSSGVEIEPVAADRDRLRRFRIAGTGSPAEGTGAVVAAVRELRDRRPRAIESAFDRLADLTLALRRELCREADRPEEVAALVREAEARLEELGVVPEPVRRLVRAVEERGGAAKISGAGSLAGPGAGNLLLYHPEPAVLDAFLGPLADPTDPSVAAPGAAELALRVYEVALGAPGARLEEGGA